MYCCVWLSLFIITFGRFIIDIVLLIVDHLLLLVYSIVLIFCVRVYLLVRVCVHVYTCEGQMTALDGCHSSCAIHLFLRHAYSLGWNLPSRLG